MFENSLYKNMSILFVVLLSLLLTVNNFIDLGINKKVSLGLDLRGGSHLLLHIDFDSYVKEQLENNVSSLKKFFLENNIKALPKLEEKNINIFYRRSQDLDLIKKQLDNFDVIEKDNNTLILSFKEKYLEELAKKVNRESIEIIRKRIDEFGTKDSLIQVEGNNNILVQVAGLSDSSELKELLGKTAKLSFHLVNDNYDNNNTITMKTIDGLYDVNINKESLLGGDSLLDASVIYDNGKPVITFKLNSYGADVFSDITANNIGKMLAIVLDNRVITAPTINTRIDGGVGIISGNFSFEEATKTALLLRSGSLVAPLKIIEEKTVGATLGQDLIEQGTKACIFGFLLTMMFIFIFYKKFGIYSNIVSIINMLFLVALLSILGATLTLPGIAGIVLTIGMSMDANILIFERIKEEYYLNKDNNSLSIINKGFDNTLSTILDANITTAIVAIVLYIFGTGAVKGFGVILLLGIISSVFSSLVCLKIILNFVYKNKKLVL